jgi:hypothetical protein
MPSHVGGEDGVEQRGDPCVAPVLTSTWHSFSEDPIIIDTQNETFQIRVLVMLLFLCFVVQSRA